MADVEDLVASYKAWEARVNALLARPDSDQAAINACYGAMAGLCDAILDALLGRPGGSGRPAVR